MKRYRILINIGSSSLVFDGFGDTPEEFIEGIKKLIELDLKNTNNFSVWEHLEIK